MKDEEIADADPSPWVPMTNAGDIHILGKLSEECGELIAAVSRALIQGAEGLDPKTGMPNTEKLEEELADVRALMALTEVRFQLNVKRIHKRSLAKMRYQQKHLDNLDEEE